MYPNEQQYLHGLAPLFSCNGFLRQEAKLNKTEEKALYYHTKKDTAKRNLNLFLSGVAKSGKLLPETVKQVHSSENERKRLNGFVGQEGV